MATNCGCEGCDFCDLKLLSPKKTLLINKGENCIFKIDLNTELVNNFNILDTQGINLIGNGTFGSPLSAIIILDPNPANILQVTAGGLLVNGTGFAYTDEQAQDAVGNILNNAEFTYSDITPLISINQIPWSKIINTPAALTLAAIGAVPNANGATLTGSVLNLQPASATFGGVIANADQTIPGGKRFDGKVGIGVAIPTTTALHVHHTNGAQPVARFTSGTTPVEIYSQSGISWISRESVPIDAFYFNDDDDTVGIDGNTIILGTAFGTTQYATFTSANITFAPKLTLLTLNHETTDVDIFLVSAVSGEIKYRTGSELFSDIITQGAALTVSLTTLTQAGAFTPDYAIQALGAGGFGFITADEGETVLSVILNMQVRINQLEARLQAHGLIA